MQPSLYIDFLGECIPLDFYTKFQLQFIKWSKVDDEDDDSDSEEDDEDDDSEPSQLTVPVISGVLQRKKTVLDIVLSWSGI